jgi:hypothetical protein
MILDSAPVHERMLHLERVMTNQRFLNMEGLGMEVPFFIAPYPPEQSDELEPRLKTLVQAVENKGVKVLHLNLYDTIIRVMQQNDDWEYFLSAEESRDPDELRRELREAFDVAEDLIPAILAQLKQQTPSVLLISGIGASYPMVRSHNLLEQLQSRVQDIPLILMFPGKFTHSPEQGSALSLFGELSNRYYRAFNVNEYEIEEQECN